MKFYKLTPRGAWLGASWRCRVYDAPRDIVWASHARTFSDTPVVALVEHRSPHRRVQWYYVLGDDWCGWLLSTGWAGVKLEAL